MQYFVLHIVKTARLDLHLINHKQAVPHYSTHRNKNHLVMLSAEDLRLTMSLTALS